MAEKVGKGLAEKVGKGLAQGWRRVGEFPCTLQFRNSRGARLETRVCDSMDCLRGGHLQNGKPVRRKIRQKGERKWKIAPGLKWPKNGRRDGISAIFLYFFHVGGHFSAISGRGTFSIFFPLFFGFCAGPVSHSIDGHRARNGPWIMLWDFFKWCLTGCPRRGCTSYQAG